MSGQVDVLGYSVHAALFESLVAHPLERELGDRARSVLLVQLDRRRSLREGYASFITSLRERSYRVRSEVIATDEQWWFSGAPEDAADTLRSTVDVTSSWLREGAIG